VAIVFTVVSEAAVGAERLSKKSIFVEPSIVSWRQSKARQQPGVPAVESPRTQSLTGAEKMEGRKRATISEVMGIERGEIDGDSKRWGDYGEEYPGMEEGEGGVCVELE
jgi:hypothetical protein